VHALDKRDHPLEPDEGAGELQHISPDRDLRIGGGHTFASHLVMKGVPLKAVQELMSHATIDMTLRYSHVSPGGRLLRRSRATGSQSAT
jgi:site-specific recombinase XerD